MKKAKFNKLNAQEKAALMEIVQEQPQILIKKKNIGWSDTPLFRSASEERQKNLF